MRITTSVLAAIGTQPKHLTPGLFSELKQLCVVGTAHPFAFVFIIFVNGTSVVIMALTADDGNKLLDECSKLAASIRQKFKVGDPVPGDAFQSAITLEPNGPPRGRAVLRHLRVIATAQGRGGPARALAEGGEKAVLQVAQAAWAALAANGRLSSDELSQLAKRESADADAPRHVADLLKELDLAVGIQRAGGLRRSDAAATEVGDAVKAAVESKTPEGERQGERAYYEAFGGVVESWEGYSVTILGTKQVGRGEWSTPDIVGIQVSEARALIVPTVRIATVEVKLSLTRFAIAEAAAHKRFAHYAYVGVPEAAVDIDPSLITELTRAGLGLLCPRQRKSVTFHAYVDAPFCRPDEEEIEFFLEQFSTEDKIPLAKMVHERVRAAMKVLFN